MSTWTEWLWSFVSSATAEPTQDDELPSVPVVDMSLPEDYVVMNLSRACLQYGFFYLANHGLPQELLDAQMEQQCKLFALPEKEKMLLLADENNRGYTPFQEETLDPARQTSGDTKEGFYIGREVAADSEEAAKPLHGPNQWPSERDLPDYRRVVAEYISGVTDVGFRLLEMIAMSLELPNDWFEDKFNRPMIALRPLHYSGQISDPENGVFAAGAHTDYGMLTLLLTDSQPGLQINHKGKWIDVPPRPDCFVVNLGDMLERWTNGKYKSTLHRVVNITGEERYSVPFFFEPNFETLVECLPQCCSEEEPAKYPPVTSGQHLLDKYSATHANWVAPSDARV